MILADTIPDHPTVGELLQRDDDALRSYLRFEDEHIGLGQLRDEVDYLAGALHAAGVNQGDRVAVVLLNHADHVRVFFACLRLGAVQIPVNTHLRGEGLGFILKHCEAAFVIADGTLGEELEDIISDLSATIIWRHAPTSLVHDTDLDLTELLAQRERRCPMVEHHPDSLAAIMYTSGTTGPPKGVLVTDRMLRASATACAAVAAMNDGSIVYIWDPLYHIGGIQTLIAGLQQRIQICLVARFSASRFWDETRDVGATHARYLGGVLQILLRQPPSPDDRDHQVRIVWGGGAPAAVWAAFEKRFGVEVHECYGMTECSSFTSINTDSPLGSTGRLVPWFNVRIVSASAETCPVGVAGEISVQAKQPGLITAGYFRNVAATATALRDGWMYTGDCGHFDEAGNLYYVGRLKDNIRRRGENVSGWEIERVVDQLDWVEACAAIGVADELDDETIKLFVKVKAGHTGSAPALFAFCEERLARFQVPEHVEFIDGFDLTATQRIRKETLPREPRPCWTRQRDGTITPP